MSKLENLQRLAGAFDIPPFVFLDRDDLATLWSSFSAVEDAFLQVCNSIRLTAAAFLDRDLSALDDLPVLEWSDDADKQLAKILAAAGLSHRDRLAVRSSSPSEDGKSQSNAGIFETILDVTGPTALRAAICKVYRSSFSRTAISQALRAGAEPRNLLGMKIILQKMIFPTWSGVAFSKSPITAYHGVLIEMVPGIGESLVSGNQSGSIFHVVDEQVEGIAEYPEQMQIALAVGNLARRTKDAFGDEVDIEWAHDGQSLWLLQARHITTSRAREDSGGPVFETTDLYSFKSDVTAFQPLPDFVHHFRAKRSKLATLARQLDVGPGTSLIIRCNRTGAKEFCTQEWVSTNFRTDKVVLDISAKIRQYLTKTENLRDALINLLTEDASTIVAREFIQGDLGLITNVISDSQVFCEYSKDGLLAINRGTASSETLTMSRTEGKVVCDGKPFPDIHLLAHTSNLFEVTQVASKMFGLVQLEWVSAETGLHLLDFSQIAKLPDNVLLSGRTISPGFAIGLPVVVGQNQELESISIAANISLTDRIPDGFKLGGSMQELIARIHEDEKPKIIVAPRPYAALAALIPYADGFIFEKGSVLCHLAILLRENGVPAVASEDLFNLVQEGEFVEVNAT